MRKLYNVYRIDRFKMFVAYREMITLFVKVIKKDLWKLLFIHSLPLYYHQTQVSTDFAMNTRT